MRALPALTSPIRETTLWLFWQVAPGNKARFHSAVQNFIKRSFCTQGVTCCLAGGGVLLAGFVVQEEEMQPAQLVFWGGHLLKADCMSCSGYTHA